MEESLVIPKRVRHVGVSWTWAKHWKQAQKIAGRCSQTLGGGLVWAKAGFPMFVDLMGLTVGKKRWDEEPSGDACDGLTVSKTKCGTSPLKTAPSIYWRATQCHVIACSGFLASRFQLSGRVKSATPKKSTTSKTTTSSSPSRQTHTNNRPNHGDGVFSPLTPSG
jgi:hypothetical protein